MPAQQEHSAATGAALPTHSIQATNILFELIADSDAHKRDPQAMRRVLANLIEAMNLLLNQTKVWFKQNAIAVQAYRLEHQSDESTLIYTLVGQDGWSEVETLSPDTLDLSAAFTQVTRHQVQQRLKSLNYMRNCWEVMNSVYSSLLRGHVSYPKAEVIKRFLHDMINKIGPQHDEFQTEPLQELQATRNMLRQASIAMFSREDAIRVSLVIREITVQMLQTIVQLADPQCVDMVALFQLQAREAGETPFQVGESPQKTWRRGANEDLEQYRARALSRASFAGQPALLRASEAELDAELDRQHNQTLPPRAAAMVRRALNFSLEVEGASDQDERITKSTDRQNLLSPASASSANYFDRGEGYDSYDSFAAGSTEIQAILADQLLGFVVHVIEQKIVGEQRAVELNQFIDDTIIICDDDQELFEWFLAEIEQKYPAEELAEREDLLQRLQQAWDEQGQDYTDESSSADKAVMLDCEKIVADQPDVIKEGDRKISEQSGEVAAAKTLDKESVCLSVKSDRDGRILSHGHFFAAAAGPDVANPPPKRDLFVAADKENEPQLNAPSA